ncbi:MAG: hypothetical protein J6386_09200 [Candidatus Synoicihabitans palmerolidicus]|nr:hypothetical protein [Candidatus Synoicihabitans palmerolidicus]
MGYAWLPFDAGNEWFWGIRAGAEFDFNSRLTAIASVGYDDEFEGSSDGAFDGSVRLNYRANDRLLPYLEVSAFEAGNWGSSIGIAYKF